MITVLEGLYTSKLVKNSCLRMSTIYVIKISHHLLKDTRNRGHDINLSISLINFYIAKDFITVQGKTIGLKWLKEILLAWALTSLTNCS